MSGVAISSYPVPTRPPRLSYGKILPKAVRHFEYHCLNYFANAKESVADNEKVARILSCFDDYLVNDWIAVERDRLITLTFEQFMAEFRTRWLPLGWEEDLRTQVLSARFDPKKTRFGAWADHVQTLNVFLRGTPSHLDEHSMRLQFEANIDEELRWLAREADANKITSLYLWVAKVKDLDDHRHDKLKRMKEAIDDFFHAHNGHFSSKPPKTKTKRRVNLPPT